MLVAFVFETISRQIITAGWLVLRTVSSGAIYALATALATKAGAEYAAAHQICLQVRLSNYQPDYGAAIKGKLS